MSDNKELASRRIGLGRTPSELGQTPEQVSAAAFSCGFTNVPVLEYVTWTIDLPLTDAVIESTFGNTIDPLSGPKQIQGVVAVDSSFVVNSILQADMLAIGFGVHIFGEPQAFSQEGNALLPPPPAGFAPPMSPDVFTVAQAADGASNTGDIAALGLPQGTTMAPALLTWGIAPWEAAWHMANGYQFQWTMNQRYQLINELAADVAYFGPYAEANAAGTSEKPLQPFVREVNNHYRELGAGAIFQPINARRVGSVSEDPLPTGVVAPGVGLFHPTRDFDLAPVTWGGIRNQGGAGCCMPFHKLPRPVLLERGIPIGMKLQAQDEFHQNLMQKWMSLSHSQGGNTANIAFDQFSTDTTVAGPPAFPELTLDQGANEYVNLRVNTNRQLFKGGTLKLAIMIKGYEVWGPWKDYFKSGKMGGAVDTENSMGMAAAQRGGGLLPMR